MLTKPEKGYNIKQIGIVEKLYLTGKPEGVFL